jgi:hypothetical protein
MKFKIALAVSIAVGSLLAIGSSANATIAATGMNAAGDRLTLTVDQVQFVFGGHKHCWYPDGWNGPGCYWCGTQGFLPRGRGFTPNSLRSGCDSAFVL